MEQNKTEITITDSIKEVVVRHGVAPEVFNPMATKVSGIIYSPHKYYASRKTYLLNEGSHSLVVVNYADKSIVFHEDTTNPLGAKITGEIKPNNELSFLGVNNQSAVVGLNDLKKKLRAAKRFFVNTDGYEKMAGSLTDFNFGKTVIGESKDDRRGNVTKKLSQSLNTNMPFEFRMNYPVFIGEPNVEVKIEIYYEIPDSGNPLFTLESSELIEKADALQKSIFESQIELFEEAGVLVIKQ